jgi:opacity protein-like surface antigen
MNRRYLAALSLCMLAVVTAAPTHAQGMTAPKPTFGVLAGLDLATLGGSDFSGVGSRTGLTLGGYVTFHLDRRFGLEPELLFTQRGASEESDGDRVTIKMDYIDVPVLVRWDVPTTGQLRPFFLAGPTLSFQVSCNGEESQGGASVSASCDDINQANPGSLSKKSVDIGATLGGGVTFPAGRKTNLSLGIRYTHGLLATFDGSDAKNRTWQFLAGLSF